jgi:hypothetical protein
MSPDQQILAAPGRQLATINSLAQLASSPDITVLKLFFLMPVIHKRFVRLS